MALGVIGVAPNEYTTLRTTLIDLPPAGDPATEAGSVIDELFGGSDRVVAHRGVRRMVPTTERVPISSPAAGAVTFKTRGTYLVTGGLGGVGFALARHLASRHEANLVIVASRPVPSGAARAEWLSRHGYDEPTSRRIRRLAELEALGTKVTVVVADLADPASVRAAFDDAGRQIGHIDGAVHAAGELRDRPIELATHEDHGVVIGAKARGAVTLLDELRARGGDLLVLTSSTSTVLLAEGQSAYVAANSVLDALAGQHGDVRVATINFGLWGEVGIAATAAHRARLGLEAGEPVAHPVLSELVVERDGTRRLVGTLSAEHHWVVDEHRSATGIAVLPGTGHIELLLAALALAGVGDGDLRDVALLEPLVVPDGTPVTVRVSITEDDGTRWAHVESDGGVGAWRLHSEAQLVVTDDDASAIHAVTAPTAPYGSTPWPARRRGSSSAHGGRPSTRRGGTATSSTGGSAPGRLSRRGSAWRAHPAARRCGHRLRRRARRARRRAVRADRLRPGSAARGTARGSRGVRPPRRVLERRAVPRRPRARR